MYVKPLLTVISANQFDFRLGETMFVYILLQIKTSLEDDMQP